MLDIAGGIKKMVVNKMDVFPALINLQSVDDISQ